MLELDCLFVEGAARIASSPMGDYSFSIHSRHRDERFSNEAEPPARDLANRIHRTRVILDPVTQQRLGKVRCLEPETSKIVRWFVRPRWEVVETDDDSLLMTIVCPRWLGRVWEVYDADDNLVCTLTKQEIYDSWGYLRATLVPSPSGSSILVRSRDRGEMGRFSYESGGLSVQFDPAINDDPYTKMAVLAAGLIRGGNERRVRDKR